MKITIDKPRCAGHGRCAAVAPGLFVLDANGYISTSELEVPKDQEALARRAARACPERIITVNESDQG
jgi:ferredoxin